MSIGKWTGNTHTLQTHLIQMLSQFQLKGIQVFCSASEPSQLTRAVGVLNEAPYRVSFKFQMQLTLKQPGEDMPMVFLSGFFSPV